MKKYAILVMTAALFASNAFAAQVKSAKLDAGKKNILIEVVYGGGCSDHHFSLQLGRCLESMPVQCGAQLIEKTTDGCEAMIYSTAVIPLSTIVRNADDARYFAGASLTITGDKDWQTGKASSAHVELP